VQKLRLPGFLPFLFSWLLLSLTTSVLAQERCGTVAYMEKLRREGKIIQTDEQFEQWLDQRKRNLQRQPQTLRTKDEHYQIPVVVHVIHNDEPIGTGVNISDEQILSQMEVLNKDFNRLNDDASNTPAIFLPVAGGMNIEFILARRDPAGLPTTGINRIKGTKTTWTMGDENIFKSLSYWPSEDYLNIWVLSFSGSFIGYAQFPVSNLPGLEPYQDGIAATDGVVIDYTAFGTSDAGPFNLDPNYNKGRTTTHEVGHFLGLRHLWGDSVCGTDHVDDTPQQRSSTDNCPSHPATSLCTVEIVKMFQNYMDYTFDECMNLFTVGQLGRMELILNDPSIPRRNSLLTSPGLLDPNCDIIDVAILHLDAPGAVTCDASPEIKFTIRNRSCSPLTSVVVDYTINGGAVQLAAFTLVPELAINAVGTLTLPATTSFQPGVNTLSVTVTQANGLPDEDPLNSFLESRIRVDALTDRIPLRERFDILSWPAVSPQDGINWQLAPTFFGNSASVQAFNQGTVGTEAWLVTPVLDFSLASKASMFFDLSYALNQNKNDQLKILVSKDCGNSYVPTPYSSYGQQIANGRTSTTSWQPVLQSDWQLRNYLNLNDLAGEENVRLAFVFTNATGNNLYLDNIEFFLSDDPDPVNLGNDEVSVYWSTNYEATVTFNLPQRMPVRILVVDLLGRTYIDTSAPDILNQTFPIELGNAASGIYIMRIQTGTRHFTSKFYLSR
jgi:hypothetical protein